MNHAWIVDDDRIYLDIVIMLSKQVPDELSFRIFESGQAFLTAFAETEPQHLPDVILLDITMPDVTGWDVLDTMRREGWTAKYGIPVHLVTSSVSQEERVRATFYPEVTEYVIKPVSVDYLQSLV